MKLNKSKRKINNEEHVIFINFSQTNLPQQLILHHHLQFKQKSKIQY